MKRVMCIGWAAVLLVAATVQAQPPPAGQRRTLAEAIKGGYNNVKMNLTQAAEKMPEGDFTFKPGTMSEVRNYGQLFAHVAQAQFGACSAAAAKPNPMTGKQLEQELKTKADIVKALNDSFALCDDAYSSLNDTNAMEFVKQGQGEIQRAALLMNNIVHDNEMFGTAAVYMRSKGMVPPSTERMRGMRGRGGH
jgi:uncharacterized damage-inducible protein DinB